MPLAGDVSEPHRAGPPPPDQWDPYDCRQLWADALSLYLRDAKAAQRGGQADHAREALEDLLGSREILARLCEPLGLDVGAVATGMRNRLPA